MKRGNACLKTFCAEQAKKGPPGEGRCPVVNGEGRIVETRTV